jgi:Glycosyl transferases group 1
MSKLYFVCPDDNTPYGGIRIIYRCVDTLNAAGVSASVVHVKSGFRCTWFENATQIAGASDVRFATGDLLVLPEFYKENIPHIAPGVPHVIFNQNPHDTFPVASRFEAGGWEPVTSPDTVGIVANSPYTSEYLRYCFPRLSVDQIMLGINQTIFRPPQKEKQRAIAFMPRKRKKDLSQVLRILDLRGALDGWELRPIERMTESETADVLRRSAVFLSLNEREGLGLPPLEAMASGCIVVGYHGGCGRLYMGDGTAFAVDDGEVVSFATQVESVLRRYGRDEELDRMSRNAIAMIEDEFTMKREAADVVRVFGGALNSVATVEPMRDRINTELLIDRQPSRIKLAISLMQHAVTRSGSQEG